MTGLAFKQDFCNESKNSADYEYFREARIHKDRLGMI